ncbi:MAG: hypothetical protein ACE5KE_02415 [Methanosarcinales archaeon]
MGLVVTLSLSKYAEKLKERGIDPLNNKELLKFCYAVLDKELEVDKK